MVPQPPPHWKKYSVSGGSVTLPARTLTAEADFPSSSAFPNGGLCVAHIDSYNVTVHPQPYNFHKVVGQGLIGVDGTLKFVYDWSSTSGNKDNLTTCFWHEYVTYPGPVGTATNPNKYDPPNPPFNFVPGVNWIYNPDVNPAPPS